VHVPVDSISVRRGHKARDYEPTAADS